MAVAVQDAMRAGESARPEAERFRFRIGVNTGEIVVDGDDVLGDCVNIAARLESLAPPGGICIGRTAHDEIKGQIDAPLTALGPQMVKNIPDPVEVWRVEIEGVAPPPAKRAERPSIAVLPFDNMSADPDQAFLADGIVEDVITELSRFRSLLVIARNSTFAYKGAAKDIREIARELDVRYVVEGSVRRAGDRLRVTAQLIEAETGAHLWAERWDRTMEDLFALQDELTTAIVTGVEPEMGAHERSQARSKPVESLTVWELCRRGDNWQASITLDKFADSEAMFRRAIEMDPESTLAHVLLARLLVSRLFLGMTEDHDSVLADGLAAAARAIELDDRDDGAHQAQAMMLIADSRTNEARAAVARALALNPNNARAHYSRAFCRLQPPFAEAREAVGDLEEAERLSPTDPMVVHFRFLTGLAWLLRDALGAEARALKAFEFASRLPNAQWYHDLAIAAIHAANGRVDNARASVMSARRRNPEATLADVPNAVPLPMWRESWKRLSKASEDLVALGFPRE
jgi:TolB-like protein/Flp pilus assembly protein TadD